MYDPDSDYILELKRGLAQAVDMSELTEAYATIDALAKALDYTHAVAEYYGPRNWC